VIHDIIVLALGAAAVGCGPKSSHVAQGETFATGNVAYDDFLKAVRDVRAQAMAAPNEEQSSHGALVKALGLESTSAPAAVIDGAGQRAKKLQDKGVVLHLEIAPEPRLLSSKAKDLGAEGEAVLKAVEESAKVSLDLRKRFSQVVARAIELEKQRVSLRDQAAATFREETQGKREEIIAELEAASAVLADAAAKADRSAGDAVQFVIDLAQAVETAGGATLDLPRPAHGKKGPAVAASLPSKPPPMAGTQKAPPAAPAPKKSKGGDDFEP
jgi:hypothetical protein